jgi:hypothetical protein
MEPFAPTVEYQVPGLQFHAAPQHRGVRARHKPCKHQCRLQRNIGDARQILLAAQQLQMMKRRPGQAGVEGTLRGNEEIDPHLAQARLVVIGVDERACAASRHLPLCIPAGSNPRSDKATMPTRNVPTRG